MDEQVAWQPTHDLGSLMLPLLRIDRALASMVLPTSTVDLHR